MNKISVTTKQGDTGNTSLQAARLSKASDVVELLGQLDTLNVKIGVIISIMNNTYECMRTRLYTLSWLRSCFRAKPYAEGGEQWSHIQQLVFEMSGDISAQKSMQNKDALSFVEDLALMYDRKLPALKHFIFPTGNKLVLALHEARVQVRTAERAFWRTSTSFKLDRNMGTFLNRLSDLCFLGARYFGLENERQWR